MADEASESERRLDRLEHRVEKNEAIAKQDKETRRAEMTAMKSELAESLARNEAANKDALARNEAANREAISGLESKVEAQGRDTQEKFVEMHKTIANLHSTVMFTGFGIIASVGVAVTLLGLFLRSGGGG